MSIGSIVNAIPARRRSPKPRRSTWSTCGAMCICLPIPCPPKARTTENPSLWAMLAMAWPMSPRRESGRTCSMPAWQTALRCLHQASLVKRALVPAHGVVYAASGKQALAAIARGDVFDLILCDIMMPEMSGMDFHEELMLSASAQAVKMVFMTGGAFTTRAREFLERVSNPRLDMHLKRDQLRAFIDGLLG